MPEEKEKQEEKVDFEGKIVKVVGADYEPGTPAGPHPWRDKLKTREEMLRYLETAERYWFSKEWFGSEKRKNPA